MDRRVLIDTSAWVEFFRGGESDVASLVDQLLAEDLAATTGVIRAELLQGARSKKDYDRLADLLTSLEQIPEPADTWSQVAHLGYSMRRSGQSGIGIPDLLVAVVAIAGGSPVLSLDKHFEAISRTTDLKLFPE